VPSARESSSVIPSAGLRSFDRCLRALTHTTLAVVGILGVVSCAPSRETGEAPAGVPAAVTPLAEARSITGAFRVQVLEVQRVGEATLEVRFALTNMQPSGRPLPITNQFAAADEDRGSVADVYLVDTEGRRKYFVLRDARHRPECSSGIAPLAPGETRTLWARFLAPPASVARVGVRFPQVASLLEVPIPGPGEPEPGSPRM
jgi:hypothetical protein